MLRYATVHRVVKHPRYATPLANGFATKRGGDTDEAELDAARKWLSKLDAETIPRTIGEVSFSRSSGPGGQNVNKYGIQAPCKV